MVPTSSYPQAAPINISKAKFIFESRCASRHTIGNGDRIGPDLAGVIERRDSAWLQRYLQDPEKMLAEGDSIARTLFEKYRKVNMPNLNLGTDDVSTMVSYLTEQSNEVSVKTRAQQSAAQANPEGRHHH